MAISDAMRYRMNTGGSAEDLYGIIRDFLATSPDAATTQAQMAQYGISGEDVANATGGKSGGLLSGNILSGASWNSLNTALPEQLTQATGQATSNYAVGGATTADTLNQLNTYLAGGGQFDPNATVFLQTGGVDFLQGVDKGTIKDNINQIVKTLGDQGVNVVLTGSPYAASINDVVTNNFDPKVDPLFNEIAKENKNVALVGVQGEILQNKKLLVDALHTNAEGTAVYNQAVIDSLSQFKNDVPSSTPDAIAQVQTSNVVATTPAQITQIAQTGQTMPVIPTTRGRVIEGDNIEQQIAGVPQVVYETRVDPNNTANWETFNPKTGEVIDRGTFAGGGDQGLLRAAAPVIGLAASTVGLPFITNLLGTATGLTGSALTGATGATIGAGTQLVTGGSAQDIARAALLGGGAGYLGNEVNNYFKYQDVPIDFNTMTTEQINDALDVNFRNDLARAGLSDAQIKSYIENPASVYDATQAVTTPTTTPVAVSTPVTDGGTVAITAPTPLSINNLLTTLGATTPTVNIAAPKGIQNVDQATLDLVNSQLATNVTKPSNLATVQVTGDRPATTQEIVNAITATIPNVTAAQAQTLAEQVITSGKQVTTQELANAVSATIPALTQTTPVATQTITGQKPITTQEIVNAITASIPAITTPVTTPTTTPLATQTITGQKPATVQEIVNAITAAIPTVTPTQAQTVAQQVITSDRPVTTQEVINAITAAIPSVIAPTTEPRVTITAEKPSSIVDAVTAATIPLIQPSTPLTVPQVTAQTTTPTVDPLRVAQLGLTAAGLLGAGSALSSGGSTQYPIVPVPDTFLTPTAPTVSTYPQLPAINFGDRNLLRGTQWEKFLDPNYGKVPAPIQYSQPSSLSYNNLMGILGSRQGMPAKSSLSINDIISGIQNQYGQTPASTMG